MNEKINQYQQMLIQCIKDLNTSAIIDFIQLLQKARDEDKQIIIMGNGGSGATASHFAGDFNKGLSLGKPRELRYRVISLVDNSPTLLSLANDVSYDDIFVEQMKNFVCEGDLVVGISGSGNSENILRAVKFAKNQGATVVGLTGYDGGKLKELSDLNLHININNMQVAEDMHMVLTHLIFYVLSEN